MILSDPVVVPLPAPQNTSNALGSERTAVKLPAPAPYGSVQIQSPADDATVRANDGTVVVQVALEPPLNLDLGHRLRVRLDGNDQPELSEGSTITLQNLPRGTHTLQVLVVERNGKLLLASPVSRFHLHREVIERPGSPKAANPR